MRIKTTVQVITFALSLLPVSVAYSHDIWLFPEQFTLSKGDTLTVRQLAGAELDAKILQAGAALELPLLRRMTPRFDLVTPRKPIAPSKMMPQE